LTTIAQCFCPRRKKEKLQEARVSVNRGNFSPSKGTIKDTINNTGRDSTVNIEAKGKVRARERAKNDGAQVQCRPTLDLGKATLGQTTRPNPNPLLNVGPISLEGEIAKNQTISFTPQFLGPRNCLQAWKDLGATKTLLKAIITGVKAPLTKARVVQSPRFRNEDILHETIKDYLQTQAIRILKPHEMSTTLTWTLIFGVEKRDSKKVRLITDLRILKNCCQTAHHKPETLKTVLKILQDPNLTWATK
jgi:hypothetical protein